MTISKAPPVHGWINLYKPTRISSAKAVSLVKRLTPRKTKVGHAGTLDPLAEGILPIAIGEATKTCDMLVGAKKIYSFTVTWGEARSTDDAEGEIVQTSDIRPSKADIDTILSKFTGEIDQTPPAYSAIKVDGKRAYDLARSGEKVELTPRKINIYSLETIDVQRDFCTFRCKCGKGTYIRSLARDMAKTLGTCGYVSMLKREVVGKFHEKSAISLDYLEKLVHSPASDGLDGLTEWLLPIDTVLDDIPAIAVDERQAQKLRHGQTLAFEAHDEPSKVVIFHEKRLIALGEMKQGQLKPKRVFNV